MYCKNCDNEAADGLSFCNVCGADLNAGAIAGFNHTAVAYDPTYNPGKKLAIISLILAITIWVLDFPCCLSLVPFLGKIISILSLFTLPGGICSIILGVMARRKSKSYGFSSKTAVTGIIIGTLSTMTGIISFTIGFISCLISILGYFGIGLGVLGYFTFLT